METFPPSQEKVDKYTQYIYDQKVLYIHKHDGYKLMEFSSIHAELAVLKVRRRRIHERERGKRNRLKRSKRHQEK